MALDHRMIETNGIRLHAVLDGPEDGPLVVLLHGFPEFWYGMRKQLEHLARLGYRVMAPDQRGYNLSDKPRGTRAYRLDVLAEDVLGLIRALGRTKAHVIGHDWGAAVAWWLACRHSEAVDKLVILNVPHPAVMRKHLFTNPRQLLRSWYMFFFQLPIAPERTLAARRFQGMKAMLRNTSHPGTFSDADLAEYERAWSQPAALPSMLGWYRAAVRGGFAGLRGSLRIEAPTLILWGKQDVALGHEMARDSLAYCSQAQLETFPNAGHWVQHEETDAVNARITEHLA